MFSSSVIFCAFIKISEVYVNYSIKFDRLSVIKYYINSEPPCIARICRLWIYSKSVYMVDDTTDKIFATLMRVDIFNERANFISGLG